MPSTDLTQKKDLQCTTNGQPCNNLYTTQQKRLSACPADGIKTGLIPGTETTSTIEQ